MLQLMLCGAHDVGELSTAFSEVARDFGAEPWFYREGSILHVNSRTSRWTANSRASVAKADVCVFVMLERYGDITWNDELDEALALGKPFLVLALESAWNRYATLHHSLLDPSVLTSDDDRRMTELLGKLESDYQLTLVPFTYANFKEKLRRQLSNLFQIGVDLVQLRTQRTALVEVLGGTGELSRSQVDQAIALATDEFETEKSERKAALRRLAADSVRDRDLVLDACRSQEQGVQRLAFELLAQLCPLPPDDELVRDLTQIAAASDDVGIARRLTTTIAQMAPFVLDTVLESMGSAEVGVRRRAYEAVEERWEDVLSSWGPLRMRQFLDRCEAREASQQSWTARLNERRDSLSAG